MRRLFAFVGPRRRWTFALTGLIPTCVLVCVVGGSVALGLAGSAAALQRAAASSRLVFSSTFAGNREIFA